METRRRILVVDDQPPVCESVSKILRKGGAEVHQVFDGQAAIEVLEREPFDVVVADLMMPRVSGMDLLEYVKEHHPRVEVVMITGYASIDSAVEATKRGAASYVPKPFTPQELTSAVDVALKRLAEAPEQPAPAAADAAAPAQAPVGELIDVDEPFDRQAVAAATTEAYPDMLTRTDVPVHAVEPNYCTKGRMVCKKYAKTGTCKGECPILVRASKKAAEAAPAALAADARGIIDVDMPFSFEEVAAATSPLYAAMVGRSDMPIHAPGWESALEGKNILVIDDEPVVCNSLRRILSRQGHRVEQALVAEEGLEKIQANRYDLVLLDLRMPGKDGLEVLTAIKENWPETKVIIVTGYASIESAVEATRRGAARYVAKPFTPEEIVRATNAAFEEIAA